MSRRVLVTGGAGFIGSRLARALLRRGDAVRVLDNFSTGDRTNLAAVEADVEIIEGELRSYERVSTAMRGVEVVFHEGALPSVPRSVQDPLTTSAVNVEGTLNVLLAARDAGARRVAFASSSSVYGNSLSLPRVENDVPDPISPYAVSKLAAERYCVSFSRAYGMETICLRYFNVFGPGQNPLTQCAAVVPRFIAALQSGQPVEIYGDGSQTRDFTYVDDVVRANLMAADLPTAEGLVVNVGSGRGTSVNELAEMVGDALGRSVTKHYLPARAGDVRDSYADLRRAGRLLAYMPEVSIEEGLRRTVGEVLEAAEAFPPPLERSAAAPPV
jgi:UDP-glucose 4-epimerase